MTRREEFCGSGLLWGACVCPFDGLAQQAGEIEGVVWGPDGEPVARATVTLEPQRDKGQTLSLLTTEAGRFRFQSVPLGVYCIKVQAIAFDQAERETGVASGRVQRLPFILTPTLIGDQKRSLTVAVVDEKGRPVPAAYVTVSTLNSSVSEAVVANEKGQAVFPRLSRKPLLLVAYANGLAGATVVPAGEEASTTFVTVRLASLMPPGVTW